MEANVPEMEELISSFIKITLSSREVAISCLETHQWNLNAAVSTFSKNEIATAEADVPNPSHEHPTLSDGSADSSPSWSPSSLSLPSPPSSHLQSARTEESPFDNQMITQGVGNIDLSADFSGETGNRSDENLDQNNGGEVNRDIARPEQSSRSISLGTVSAEHQEELLKEYICTITVWRDGEAEHTYNTTMCRTVLSIINSLFSTLNLPVTDVHEIMSGLLPSIEFDPAHFQVKVIRREQEYYGRTLVGSDSASTEIQRYPVVTLIVTIWQNGFTVGDSPLMSLDNPKNAAILERFTMAESSGLLRPTRIRVSIRRRGEDSSESPSFPGVGRTLAESGSVCTEPQDLAASPPSSMGLVVVDQAAPTTRIQLRLADGTRIVTWFNTHRTVRDVRDFIDASRPDDSRDYQLLIMGSPPTPLSDDFNQTIEEAGIANSVLIQQF